MALKNATFKPTGDAIEITLEIEGNPREIAGDLSLISEMYGENVLTGEPLPPNPLAVSAKVIEELCDEGLAPKFNA